MIQIDTGDSVFHRPTRERWLVAFVEGDALYPCGWPLSRANLAHCLLVNKATPAERDSLLHDLAGANRDDPRCRHARAVLDAQRSE